MPAPITDGGVEDLCKTLLAHLSLMFVPAGVGIVGRLDVLAAHGLALAVVLVISVVASLIATAFTFTAVARRMRPVPVESAEEASGPPA